MVIIAWLPESPRYLLQEARRKKDQMFYKKAFDALCSLRNSPLQAGRDLFLMDHLLEAELHNRRSLWIRLTELFTKGRNYRAFRASLILLVIQQLSGVNVFIYNGPTIFKLAGFTKDDSLSASMAFGVINFLCALPAFYLIDHRRFGRRNLLLFTFPFMALFQLFTTVAFSLREGPRKVLTMVGMCMSRVTSCAWLIGRLTTSDVFQIFSAQRTVLEKGLYRSCMQPSRCRYTSEILVCVPQVIAQSTGLVNIKIGMSIVTAVNWLLNWGLAVAFLQMKHKLTMSGAVGFYAGMCVACWFLVFLFVLQFPAPSSRLSRKADLFSLVPETRGLSLEELDEVYGVPTKEYGRYACAQFKYIDARYIMGVKRVAPDPLRRRERGFMPPLPADKSRAGW